MPTNTWSARGHLDQLGIDHETLTHADVVTLSYSLHGWRVEPTHARRRPGRSSRSVWLLAALNNRWALPARRSGMGHVADLEDGGRPVDAVVLMAIVQRHFVPAPASDVGRQPRWRRQLRPRTPRRPAFERVLDEVGTYPLRNGRPAPLGARWWER